MVSPKGEVLVKASDDGEEVALVDIEPEDAEDKHVTPENDIFKDRRSDLFPRLID